MNKIETLAVFLKNVINGNLEDFLKLFQTPHSELLQASRLLQASGLILSKKNLRELLSKFQNGEVRETEIQKWACFIRRGYFPSSAQEPLQPLNIAFEPESEDLLNEITLRLEELGDLIDGEISKKELQKMISTLEAERSLPAHEG